MAEKLKTTSSKGFNEKIAHTHILTPHNGAAVRKIMEHDSVSKTKQSFQTEREDWQTLVQSKNQLKRKKKLSASLTSVGDTVNQEKRTRIEGIHLNIKSRSKDNNGTNEIVITKAASKHQQQLQSQQQQLHQQQTPNKVERPVIIGGVNVLSTAPQRFKRKLQENVDTIQKLNALAEQLRLEVNELKSSLITERSAVRALRAQNDADSRKWRNDVKKLQQTLETTKKSNANVKKPNELAVEASNSHVAVDGLINHEIQRLTNEIAVLKEANRTKEEKTQIIGQADRQKAADMRQLKTAYENRLTQIQKSAKIEITRLLEEIKTKERNIGQLKKDLQTLQNGRRTSEAKTKLKTNESSQKLAKKPKTKDTTTQTTTTIPTITIATKAKNETDKTEEDIPPNPLYQAQVTSEITQLKNIELINNTKNVHKSTLEMRTTTKAKQHEEKNDEHEEIIRREEGTVATTTAWMETLLASSTTTAKPTTVEYRTKDNHSDTDSALSSAPPSISPQPPSSGADSGVMWQALQDLDKLQKEVEIYHKENERLQNELQLIKHELLSTEKAALSASGSSKSHINELLQRIKELEEQQLQLSGEADELREQNELLEFRILELEDDKMDGTCEDHCQRLENLLRKSTIGGQLEDKDKRCLQQLLQCVQQLDLDAMADYDSWQSATKSEPRVRQSSHSRIVATVQPYTNSTSPSVPTTPSKRVCHSSWQNTSLSESGVFVECDLLSTHTDTETETERLPQSLPSSPSHPHSHQQPHPHLQYYQERLVQLEGKLLVYESSGETQAKHLAERLQRELQLNKQVKELIERVELLVEQNALLDEAKCEFEEAENDTRLHLQQNQEDLEILRQRNVELEFSKEALGAKYRDCRAECLILREDLGAAETQLEHLHLERQRAKQQLESLRRSLPLLLICRLLALAKTRSGQTIMGNEQSTYVDKSRVVDGSRLPGGARCPCCVNKEPAQGGGSCCAKKDLKEQRKKEPAQGGPCCANKEQRNKELVQGSPNPREVAYLKEEVKNLRCSLQDLNTRHYEAMETADSHWVELEREYKAREEAYRAKEVSLKQKICKLQECLREDSRAAAEKIQQLEETEQGLKCCLVRITKEHRDLVDRNRCMERESEARSAQEKQALDRLGPLCEELETEKRRSQALIDDLAFTKKLQQSMEEQLQAETDCLRQQIYDLKKELMHIEVTNGELREEVCTLEAKICELEGKLKESLDRASCLEDELRTKDEQIELMERKLGVCPEGHSLADELFDSPEKRAKLEEIADLESASQGLGCALRDLEKRDRELPTHKDFQTIACSVKQLADAILSTQKPEVSENQRRGSNCDCGKSKKGTPCECSPPGGQTEATNKVEGGDPCSCRKSAGQSEATDNVEEDLTVNGEVSEDRFKGGTVAPSVSLVEGMSMLGQKLRKQLKILTRLVCREQSVEPKFGESKQILAKQSSRLIPQSSPRLSSKSSPTIKSITKRSPRRRLAARTPLKTSAKQSSERSSTRPSLHQEASDVAMAPCCSSPKQQVPQLNRRRHQCKRFIARRIYRTRVRRSGATNRPIELMPLERRKKDAVSFHSMLSLHTIHTDRSSASTQTQFASVVDVLWDQAHLKNMNQWHNQLVQASVLMHDQQLQTDVLWCTQDCAIQADNVGVEQRLLLLPTRTRGFIVLLQEKIVDDGSFNVDVFRSRVLQLWEGSEEFREHIELLQDLNATTASNMTVSYDIFVAVLGCVRALKLALKPCSSSLLLLLEERINERLIKFHHRKVESEFYCTIYLPVERRNSLNLTDGKEQGA